MSGLNVLSKYFGSGTAETESSFLDKAFVPHEDYLSIITLQPASPRLLIGKKGSGKSAFLRFFKSQMADGGAPALMLRPKDIHLEINDTNDTSLGYLTRVAEKAILKAIGVQLGKDIEGLIIKDTDKELFSLAQKEGYKNDDTVQKILRILAPIGQTISNVDFKKIAASTHGISDQKIKTAVKSTLSGSQRFFYLLIDDTDQLAPPDNSNQLNRIWAFLLATRSIMEECDNIKCIITLRNEIWKRLGRNEAGQRDQVDHFRTFIHLLNPDEDAVRKIIEKRIKLACNEYKGEIYQEPYGPFFDERRVTIPSTENIKRYWVDFIVKSSRERPRDGIQLVSMLAKDAIKKKWGKIKSNNATAIFNTYSEQRVDDLKREVDEECPAIKEIVRSFASINYDAGSFTLKPDSAYEYLKKMPNRFSLTLFGKTLNSEKKADIFLLWQFLHEVGFLNARISDERMKDGYRHITVDDDPDLVSMARWNDMQKIAWEIHPAYRSYLIKIQKENSFNIGFPNKISHY
ncbi:P-loop ATPase, Sll1717 family [Desulfocicer niacini]